MTIFSIKTSGYSLNFSCTPIIGELNCAQIPQSSPIVILSRRQHVIVPPPPLPALLFNYSALPSIGFRCGAFRHTRASSRPGRHRRQRSLGNADTNATPHHPPHYQRPHCQVHSPPCPTHQLSTLHPALTAGNADRSLSLPHNHILLPIY